MASSPSYGERPPLQGFRRSFTVPHRTLSVHERAGLSTADADSETLFTHPSVKIITFSPPLESIVSKSSATHADADYPIDTVETLPWRSRTETTVASGRTIIEKVPGSVWFLKCGSQFVYSILRNSQCWCVDGESKFVLRKGRLQYYRLELPNSTEEEKAKTEELKVALAKVLKFERTPCPFKRGFHVDLPDDAITPRRTGKWTKKEGSLTTTPDSNAPSLRRTKGTRSWSLQTQSPLPVPESRRTSDYGFAKRLLPTPPQRDTLRGLRPGTPSSTASSEEVASQGQREDYSDDGSSADESLISQKEEAPDAATKISDEADDVSVETDMPQEPIQPVAEEESNPILSTNPTPPEEVHVQPAEAMTVPSPEQENHLDETSATEEGFIHVESTEGEDIPNNVTRSEPSSEEHPLPPESSAEKESPPVRPEEEEVPQGSSLPTPEERILFETIQEPEAVPVSATELEQRDINDDLLEPETVMATATEHDDQPPAEIMEPNSEHEIGVLETAVPEDRPGSKDEHPQQEEAAEAEFHEYHDPEVRSKEFSVDETLDDPLDDTASVASTTESFHTLASEDQMPPPDLLEAEQLNPMNLRQSQHKRGVSEMTVTASNFDGQSEDEPLDRFVTSDEIADRPSTPRVLKSSSSDESRPDIRTPANIQDGLRQRLKSRRSLSPMPSSSNVFTPQAQNHPGHMTSVLLQKACNLALVKPIEVVVLVVHILARIAGGASLNDLLTGELFKRPDQREQHRRTSSFPDRISPHHDEDEDDFGVPLRGRRQSSAVIASNPSHDTDTDSLFDLD